MLAFAIRAFWLDRFERLGDKLGEFSVSAFWHWRLACWASSVLGILILREASGVLWAL